MRAQLRGWTLSSSLNFALGLTSNMGTAAQQTAPSDSKPASSQPAAKTLHGQSKNSAASVDSPESEGEGPEYKRDSTTSSPCGHSGRFLQDRCQRHVR